METLYREEVQILCALLRGDATKFTLKDIYESDGRLTCWGCGNVTSLGEKDQCECKQ